MIRAVVGTCGYVESAKTSYLIWNSREGHETRWGALSSLAHQLLALYQENAAPMSVRGKKKQCCRDAQDGKYCPECGLRLVEVKFDWERFADWVDGLHGHPCDGIGDLEEFGLWSPWMGLNEFINTPKEEILYIAERFELFIVFAMDEKRLPPEMVKSWKTYVNYTDEWCPWNRFEPGPLDQELERKKYSTCGPA